MADPEALKKALETRIRKKRLPLIPFIVASIILFNVLVSAAESGQWIFALIVLLFVGFWVQAAVLPKIKQTMREVAEEAKTNTEPSASGGTASIAPSNRRNRRSSHNSPVPTKSAKSKRKHCKSCNIRHSPDTRYCRRCGAPLLR